MKSLLNFLLIASLLTFPISGGASIKTAIDELNYSLQVEWDQTDKVFYDAAVENFKKQIAQAKALGLSNEQIMQEVLVGLKDESVKKEFTHLLSQIDEEKFSEKEMMDQLMFVAKKSSIQGARWDGLFEENKTLFILGPILLVLIVLAISSSERNQEEAEITNGGYTGGPDGAETNPAPEGWTPPVTTTPTPSTGTTTPPETTPTYTPPPSASYTCEYRMTCMSGFGAAGLDDNGTPFSAYGHSYDSCGYHYVCGFFY